MTSIIKMQFGSHVYGTNLPTSDRDYKAVYIPAARDIVLQRVKTTIHESTKADERAKNTADDVDVEHFSLDKYLSLLMQGQTVAIDMLFTPEEFWLKDESARCGDLWTYLRANRLEFLSRGVNSYVGYARTQAAKYGLKGGRIATFRRVLEALEPIRRHDKIGDHAELWQGLASTTEHMSVMELPVRTRAGNDQASRGVQS